MCIYNNDVRRAQTPMDNLRLSFFVQNKSFKLYKARQMLTNDHHQQQHHIVHMAMPVRLTTFA